MNTGKVFRYDTSGRWFKGNTHLHSIASDGGRTFPDLARLYHGAGYDFLFRTDHWVDSGAAAAPAENDPMLWLDGIELDGFDRTGAYFHVVCLGRVRDLRPADDFEAALRSARRQGALLVLAHPNFCANTTDDCLRWSFDGVEIYNHICHWLNGKSEGLAYWCSALEKRPATLGFAADDVHLLGEDSVWNGGWIVVNAPELTAAAITGAIRRGNFYASCGPEIRAIRFDGGVLHLETSPVRFARLVGPAAHGERIGSYGGRLFSEASFTVPGGWRYAYVEIEDGQGRRAWTNHLFVSP